MPLVKNLTPQLRLFVDAYSSGPLELDATASARAAGYADPVKAGRKCLAIKVVRKAIDRRRKKRSVGRGELLGEITEIAMAPWRDFVTIKLDDEGNTVSVKVDLGSKTKMLELLAKHAGLTMDPLQRKLAAMIANEIDSSRAVRLRIAGMQGAKAQKDAGLKRRGLLKAPAQPSIVDVQATVVPPSKPQSEPVPSSPTPALTKPPLIEPPATSRAGKHN